MLRAWYRAARREYLWSFDSSYAALFVYCAQSQSLFPSTCTKIPPMSSQLEQRSLSNVAFHGQMKAKRYTWVFNMYYAVSPSAFKCSA